MQYSFLGFSVSKMMELNLDMKDMAILRYFVDFKDTKKMITEVIKGKTYYWVNYRSMEEDMPYLGLGKRTIMTRMPKLRDMGILNHYTKKEGGTFSFFRLGFKYNELINKEYKKATKENNTNKINNKANNETFGNKKIFLQDAISLKEELLEDKESNLLKDNGYENFDSGTVIEESHDDDDERLDTLPNYDYGVFESSDSVLRHKDGVFEKEERVSLKNAKGCISKGITKTHLLNNSSTKETNIKKYIKKEVEEIVNYLNSKINTKYKANSKNTIRLITDRLREGFSIDDFKTVIDKKFKTWFRTEFEQYLTPYILFGYKFEQYLNQKIVSKAIKSKNNSEPPKLRFDNFKGRDYDYVELERKLLGW